MNQVAIKQKTDVATERTDSFKDFLLRKREEVESILPAHVSFDKFQRVVLTAIGMNKELLQDGASLFQSCLQCASDGLMPDGREAAFVTFNTKVNNEWIKKVQYMPMIKGLIKLARNSGEVTNFTAQVVYENDKFSFDLASEERPRHEIDLTKPRGKLLAAYAIANFKDNSFQLEVMTRDEIERIKACSKGIKTDKDGNQSGIWVSWESEMWRKTVAKRLMKYLSLSPELARAIDADNAMYDLSQLRSQEKPKAISLNDDFIQIESQVDGEELAQEADEEIIEAITQDAEVKPQESPVASKKIFIREIIAQVEACLFYDEIYKVLDKNFNNIDPNDYLELSKQIAPFVKEAGIPDLDKLVYESISIITLLYTFESNEALSNWVGAENCPPAIQAIIAIRKKELKKA